jgi:predicted N-acetyltransferase YhbS
MVRFRREHDADIVARETLLDAALGPFRRLKTSERLREGRLPAPGLSFVASVDQRLVGTVRLWSITAGPARPALLLGPLAVDAAMRAAGIGAGLVNTAVAHALQLGHRAILLVGGPLTMAGSVSRVPGRVRYGCRDRATPNVCSRSNSSTARSWARAG